MTDNNHQRLSKLTPTQVTHSTVTPLTVHWHETSMHQTIQHARFLPSQFRPASCMVGNNPAWLLAESFSPRQIFAYSRDCCLKYDMTRLCLDMPCMHSARDLSQLLVSNNDLQPCSFLQRRAAALCENFAKTQSLSMAGMAFS